MGRAEDLAPQKPAATGEPLAPQNRSKLLPRGRPFPKGVSGNPGAQFKPGRSGNPGGRPQGAVYAKAFRKVSRMRVSQLEINPRDRVAFALAKVTAKEGLRGKIQAIIEIANRVDGPPTQTIDYGPLQAVYEAEPGPPRVAELIKRVAAVMVDRSEAYDLALPDFAQEVKAEMEAEAAEAERDGIIEPPKTFGTPPEGEEPQKGPVGGADDKTGEEK
jgi:hypothetical protein